MRLFILLSLFALFSMLCSAQGGFYFGPKGGVSVGTQKWNFTDRGPLLAFHGDLLVESRDEEGRGSLFAQLGFHTRGSSTQFINFISGNRTNIGFRFNNVVLQLGIKKRLDINRNPVIYYMAGIRGEYTISTNLSEFQNPNALNFYPLPDFVRNFMYGITVGGGFEYKKLDKVIPYLELAFMPDLSPQYDQFLPLAANDPISGNPISIAPKVVRNVSIEVTFGLKFLREVIYVD